MASESSDKTSNTPPAPEVLKPQSDDPKIDEEKTTAPHSSSEPPKARRTLRRSTYKPSHKATFIGVGVIVGVLVINAAIVMFVLNGQNSAQESALQSQVTLSTETLDKLGVSKTPIGDEGTELIVGLNAQFERSLTVAGDVNLGGQLKLNNKLVAADASLTKLDAGDTTLSQLNVNGDGTLSTLNLRQDLNVVGTTRLQGTVTISQLLTVNNNVNILGNLAVGGTLTVRNFQASSLVSDTTLTIGGRIIIRGSVPSVSPGPGVGSNGTVSISGSDTAGTIGVNTGTGAGSGILANVSFRSAYGTTPRVVVSIVGSGAGSIYTSRTTSGFSVGVNGALAPGGYAIDYIVVQ